MRILIANDDGIYSPGLTKLAQIAAGFGSWLGGILQLTPEDRRIAVVVGMGAGIGAIFKAPLGGAILGSNWPAA